MKREIKYVDLFAGIGGFASAIESFNNDKIKVENVLVSEIDKKAIKTYINNFGVKEENIVDIKKIKEQEIGDFDVLLGGFPCQSFSFAGKRLGFLDQTKGTLFFDILRILKVKKPKYLLLENVKGIINHNNGKTYELIINALKDLDYVLNKNDLILSPNEFGVPQQRERIFIVGVHQDYLKENIKNLDINLDKYKDSTFVNNNDYQDLRNIIDKDWLDKKVDNKWFLNGNLKKDKYLLEVFEAWNDFIKNIKLIENKTLPTIWVDEFGKDYDINNLVEWKRNLISKIRNIYNLNKNFIDKWMIKYNVENWNIREKKLEFQAGKEVKELKECFIQLRQSGIRVKRGGIFPTLVAMVQIPLLFDKKYNNWRYLSTKEVSRLQCFDKKFKLYDEIEVDNKGLVSNKQLGNAVNVKIVKIILQELLFNY